MLQATCWGRWRYSCRLIECACWKQKSLQTGSSLIKFDRLMTPTSCCQEKSLWLRTIQQKHWTPLMKFCYHQEGSKKRCLNRWKLHRQWSADHFLWFQSVKHLKHRRKRLMEFLWKFHCRNRCFSNLFRLRSQRLEVSEFQHSKYESLVNARRLWRMLINLKGKFEFLISTEVTSRFPSPAKWFPVMMKKSFSLLGIFWLTTRQV